MLAHFLPVLLRLFADKARSGLAGFVVAEAMAVLDKDIVAQAEAAVARKMTGSEHHGGVVAHGGGKQGYQYQQQGGFHGKRAWNSGSNANWTSQKNWKLNDWQDAKKRKWVPLEGKDAAPKTPPR